MNSTISGEGLALGRSSDSRQGQKKVKTTMKKLMKSATLLASVGAMLCFAGCDRNAVHAVAQEALTCLSKCDMDGVNRYATGAFERSVRSWTGMIECAEKNDGTFDAKDNEEIKKVRKSWINYKIGGISVNGDKATVSVTFEGRSERLMTLVKVGDKWMIEDFNL